MLQEKLVQAIKRIKHELDECREAGRETYVESVEVEVCAALLILIFSNIHSSNSAWSQFNATQMSLHLKLFCWRNILKTVSVFKALPLNFPLPVSQSSFDVLEREIRAEFQNLHRFLDEEEYKDLERLKRERQKQIKQLKEREKKIAQQGRDLEGAITVLNGKLAEEDSPKLLKVRRKGLTVT